MQAVLDIDRPTTGNPDTTPPPSQTSNVGRPTANRGGKRTLRDGQANFGHQALFFVPASLLIAFLAGTIGVSFWTDDLWAAVGFGVYVAFWLGGGGGFLAAGIRWGLLLEAADHGPEREAKP